MAKYLDNNGLSYFWEKIKNLVYKFTYARSNPIYYGADPTGSSDSTAAVQACVNANENGVVIFSPGTYRITDSIVTKNPVASRVSFDLNGATLRFSPSVAKTMFEMGQIDIPSYAEPGRTKTFIKNGTIITSLDGCTGVKVHEELKDFSLENVLMQGFKVGIEAGETGTSIDFYMDNCIIFYDLGSGGQTGAIGVHLKGMDSVLTNSKIFGFQYSIVADGGGNEFIHIHNLPKNVVANDISTMAFLLVNSSGVQFLTDCYCDSYGSFIKSGDNAVNVNMVNCMFFVMSALRAGQNVVFDLVDQTNQSYQNIIHASGCEFDLGTNGYNAGVRLSSSNNVTNAKTLFRDSIKFTDCRVSGTVRTGDLIMSGFSNNYWWFNAQGGTNWNIVGCYPVPKEPNYIATFKATWAFEGGIVEDTFVIKIDGSRGSEAVNYIKAVGTLESYAYYGVGLWYDPTLNVAIAKIYCKYENINFGILSLEQVGGYTPFYTPISTMGPASLATTNYTGQYIHRT